MAQDFDHDGRHIDCLPCDITKIAKPHWWTARFDARDIVIVVLVCVLLIMLAWY